MEELTSRRDVVENCTGKVGYNPRLIMRVLTDMGTNQEDATEEQLTQAMETAKDEYMVMLFLLNSDKTQYQGRLRKIWRTVFLLEAMSTQRPSMLHTPYS
jgi:hypothetical protein